MDSKGNIYQLKNDEEREALERHLREKLKEIPAGDVERLKAASLKERLAWYEKRAFNAPPECLAADDEAKVRNALKRKRRERAGK